MRREKESNKKLKKTEGLRETHTNHTQYDVRHIEVNKAFPLRSLSPDNFDEQNPSGEKVNGFSKWLERSAYALCEHCVVDNRGHPICLYIYNLPAYCTIENCPYVEEDGP